MIGLVLFGLHLIALGHIMWSSAVAPKWVAVAPIVAGAVYLVDSIGYTVLTDYAEYANVFTAIVVGPAIVSEGVLTIWLLRRGHAGRGPTPPSVDVRGSGRPAVPAAS